MKEIGSEFWDIPTTITTNSLFPENTQWFLSGRSALLAIIRENHFRTVALPSWCCESMIVPFLRSGVEVKFYPVHLMGNELVQDYLKNADTDAILIMDYFGYGDSLDFSAFPRKVIRDVTHSVFSVSYQNADYYFGSIRKWAGFWTGGFTWGLKGEDFKTDENYAALRKSAMQAKMQYIHGSSNDKSYLKVFEEAEEYLDECEIASADIRDITKAKSLDVKTLKEKRRKNAKVLLNYVADNAIFPTLNESDCPLFVPILVPHGKRNELKQYLCRKEIYCPVHWPISKHHKIEAISQRIYDDELSLVCDQRYTEEDMERIVLTIRNFWKGV